MKSLLSLLLVTGLVLPGLAQVPTGGVPGDSTNRVRVSPGTTTGDSTRRNRAGMAPAAGRPDEAAAPKGNGKISGVVIDSTTNKPVEFSTIALLNPQTGKPIDGTTSDDKGRFTLGKIAPGEYRLQYSFIGYKNKETGRIRIGRGTELNLGNIKLRPDVRTLQEVNVVGQAALVEEKVDRLVFNADKDIMAKGGDATDIMRKVPMLSVDLDGNVTLRGNSNVRVLINNKPSTIVASSVADALKQIPADQIKTIEVITSPSAKYDAEGSAGIINIITKKNNLQGSTLNVDVGQGNRGTSLNLNGNYRTGKMGFSLGGFGRAEYNIHGTFNNIQTAGETTQIQTANTRNQRLFGNYQLGWDYDIDKNTSLTASLRYGARNGNTFQDNLTTLSYAPIAGLPNQSFSRNSRNVDTKDLSGTVDASVTYTRTYKPQQELSILALYSRNNRTNNFIADILGGTDFQTITSHLRNDNLSYNQESALQVDYQKPLKTNQLLEFGGKGTFRQVNSRYDYLIANSTDAPYVPNPSQPSNSLNYNQNIAASYLSYTYTSKTRYTLKAGARYEYTFINASFGNESSGTLGKIPNYGTLVPSINLSKSLKGGKTIKVAYNRRIQRPGIQFLNPNIVSSNPTNITQGNPYLSPELTNNVELGLSGQVKAFYLSASLFGRRTSNEITGVRSVDSTSFGNVTNPVFQQVIKTTYENVGHEDAYGLNLFTNATFFTKWQIGGGVDIYHVSLTNNNSNPIYAASNAGWVVGGRVNTSLTFKKGWALQGFGGMRGKQIQLQGYQGSFAFYSFGLRKEFNEKRGTVGLAAENFLNHPFRVRSEISSPILNQNTLTSFYNAGFRVNFSYRLGKMGFDQPRRNRKSIENDDQKSEGGDQAAPAAPATGGGRPRG